MDNNRRIEIGQIRKVNSSYPEEIYHIVNFSSLTVEVVMLSGFDKGERLRWLIAPTEKDIVVM